MIERYSLDMLKYKIIFLLLISFLVVTKTTYASETSPSTLLITFTDINDPKDYVNYYKYDPINKDEKHLARYRSDIYPTGMLSNDAKFLYVNRSRTLGGRDYVQLHRWSLPVTSTEDSTLLTSHRNIWNVDFLRINNKNSQIYMRIVQPNYFNAQLASFDLQNNTTTIWDKQNKDTEVQNFDYNPVTDQVIVLEHSMTEEVSKLKRANSQESPLQPLTYHVVLYNSSGKKIREVTTIKKNILDISFAPDGKKALFTATDHYSSESKYTVYSLDLQNHKVTPIFSETDQYTKIKQAQYSPDSKKIYFLTIRKDAPFLSKDPLRRARPRILAVYDVSTGKISEVWKKEKGTINNFVVLR